VTNKIVVRYRRHGSELTRLRREDALNRNARTFQESPPVLRMCRIYPFFVTSITIPGGILNGTLYEARHNVFSSAGARRAASSRWPDWRDIPQPNGLTIHCFLSTVR